MAKQTLDENRIKDLFKQAMTELLEERRDLFYNLFAEVIEDTALVNAIREGKDDEMVSRETIFQALEGDR